MYILTNLLALLSLLCLFLYYYVIIIIIVNIVLLLAGGQDEKAEACLAAAVLCRRLRTRDPTVAGRDFADEANAQMALSISASKAVLPHGVEGPAILQHLPERLRCTDLVARFVTALPPLLRPVLSALAGNGNLENLVLECCGLTGAHAPHLVELLPSLPALALLELSSNPLRDAGAQAVLGAARGRVKSLKLNGVGMTAASLPAAGDFASAAAAGRLELASNDLWEPGEECPLTQSFCAACGSSTGLKALQLNNTRLQPGQLEHVARMVSSALALETLVLVDVGMVHRFAKLGPENPLLSAFRCETCRVRKVDVSFKEYPDLWQAFITAAKRKGKDKGKGKGKVKGKGTREMEAGDVDGSSTAAASRGQRLFFPSEVAVRVKDFKMHPRRPPTATLCTEGWSLQASVPDGNLSADDIGKVFTIGLDVRFESNSVSRGFTAVVHHCDTMTCVSCDPCSQNFAALDCVCLVFHRPCTQEVLLVHDWTDAAKTLRKRIDEFILDDEFVLQERFGNAKKEGMEVMSGLNVQDFSSFEVNVLAKLADQTAYETWLGRRAIFSARQVTDFNRLKESAEIAKLMKLFQEESQRRPFARSLPYQLPGKQLAAERKVDKEHEVDLPACLEACFQKHFASRALLERSSEAEAPAGLACVNPSGTWCRRLFHVTVPESMVEQGGVAGLRPSERPATWVRVRDLHQHLDHEDAY